jgi:hypothetical protein
LDLKIAVKNKSIDEFPWFYNFIAVEIKVTLKKIPVFGYGREESVAVYI